MYLSYSNKNMKKRILIICGIILWIIIARWCLIYYNSNNREYNWEYISYYENGQIKGKWNYENGQPVWEMVVYYENGQIQWKCDIKDGYWECVYYDENWNFEMRWKWNFVYGEINWEWTYFYENWQIESKWFFNRWVLNWELIYYHENGNIAMKWYYENGQPVWEMVVYYENGQIQQKKYFKNWKLEWELTYYYEDGQINSKIDFKDWMPNWKYIYYFKDGKITDMNYKDWKKDWKQIWYYEDGSVRFLHNFKDWIGTKSYYNRDWSLMWTWSEIYTDEFDEEIWEYKSIINWLEIYYYNNGQVQKISNYKDGELDWTQTLYYENWEIESICNYTYWIEKECVNEGIITYHINILSPTPEYTITDRKLDIIGYIEDLPDSKANIYIDNNLTASTIVDSEWIINQSIENIDSWKHSLKITIQDIDWNILWESDEINFYLS